MGVHDTPGLERRQQTFTRCPRKKLVEQLTDVWALLQDRLVRIIRQIQKRGWPFKNTDTVSRCTGARLSLQTPAGNPATSCCKRSSSSLKDS